MAVPHHSPHRAVEQPVVPPNAAETREIGALLKHFGGDGATLERVHGVLDGQLSVVYGRAQSLVQMAGVVISVTGFSGRIIADTNVAAQNFIVGGLGLVALAAALALLLVSPIQWATADLHRPPAEWILVTIRRRHRKYRAVRVANAVLVAGVALYALAIIQMLLHPEAAELKRVR